MQQRVMWRRHNEHGEDTTSVEEAQPIYREEVDE